MSHHSSNQPFNESDEQRANRERVEKMLSDQMKNLLGEFPKGKLNADDEGALAVAISANQGKVVINFPKPVQWIGFTPEQAVQIAQSLIQRAREAGFKSPFTIRL